MTSTETAAALAAAQFKLSSASDRIAVLQEQERTLSDAIGEAVANVEDASILKAERATVRDELEDLLYSQKVLSARADQATVAHRDAKSAEHATAMQAHASTMRSAASAFEAALKTIKTTHADFVTAGAALQDLAKAGGDQFASRFATAQLAEDLLQRRLYGKQNPEYDRPVPALVGPLLEHLETI